MYESNEYSDFSEATCCTLSKSNKFVYCATNRGMRKWDIETGALKSSFSNIRFGVICCSLSHDDKLLYVGTNDKKLTSWSVDSGKTNKKTFFFFLSVPLRTGYETQVQKKI